MLSNSPVPYLTRLLNGFQLLTPCTCETWLDAAALVLQTLSVDIRFSCEKFIKRIKHQYIYMFSVQSDHQRSYFYQPAMWVYVVTGGDRAQQRLACPTCPVTDQPVLPITTSQSAARYQIKITDQDTRSRPTGFIYRIFRKIEHLCI